MNKKPLRVLFFGTPEFAALGLKKLISDSRYQVCLIVTQPDRPAGRGNKLQPSPVKMLATEHSIPLLQPTSIRKNPTKFIEQLAAFGLFDVAVVIAFGQILPLNVLTYPRAGSINIHASLLPRWRGAAPIHRALISGDTESGVCLMKMEQGLDTGAIYSLIKVSVQPDDNLLSLHNRLAQAGADLLVQDLEKIVAGEIKSTPQAEIGISYAKKISNIEAEINWQSSAAELANLVRGLSPAPGAYSFLEGKRIKILAASAATTDSIAAAGEITNCGQDRLEVCCGKGVLSVKELQLEGKKRMLVAEFVKGNTVRVGSYFKNSNEQK